MHLRWNWGIGVVCLVGLGGSNVLGADLAAFERSFEDATLRVDYHHGGNATTEFVVWDRAIRQPGIWAGSRVHLIDPFAVGRTVVEVRDAASDEVLFSKRSDSYLAEYRTTAPAASGVERIYHESALIPFPKRPVKFSVRVRDRDRTERTLLTRVIDPTDRATIAREPLRPGVVVVESHRSGDPHSRVDVAIVGEGYTKTDEAKFRADLARFTFVLLGQEPYWSSRDKFNVRGVWAASNDSGADEPARGVWRDTAVGTRFDSLGSERYLLTEENRALRAIAAHVPYDTIYVMVNSSRYGGGGIYNLFCTFTTDNQWSPYVFLHEFGHSFAALADEYYSSNVAYTDFFPKGIEPIEPNITALLDPKAVKWGDLVTPGTPIPTPWGKADFDAAEVAYQTAPGRTQRHDHPCRPGNHHGAASKEVAGLKAEAEAASRAQAEAVDARLASQVRSLGKVGAFEGAGYTSQGALSTRARLHHVLAGRQALLPRLPPRDRADHRLLRRDRSDPGALKKPAANREGLRRVAKVMSGRRRRSAEFAGLRLGHELLTAQDADDHVGG